MDRDAIDARLVHLHRLLRDPAGPDVPAAIDAIRTWRDELGKVEMATVATPMAAATVTATGTAAATPAIDSSAATGTVATADASTSTRVRVYLREWCESDGLVGLVYDVLLFLTPREMEAARRVASWMAKAADDAAMHGARQWVAAHFPAGARVPAPDDCPSGGRATEALQFVRAVSATAAATGVLVEGGRLWTCGGSCHGLPLLRAVAAEGASRAGDRGGPV